MTTQITKPTEDRSLTEFVPFGSEDRIKLSVNIVRSMIAVPTKSGKMPSDVECLKFVALCRARRLNPFEGDCFLLGYDGKDGRPSFSLITAHQAFLKRAELNPEFDGMKSGIIVRNEDGSLTDLESDFYTDEQQVVGGWATVYFKNRKQPMHRRLRLKRFQKSWGVWQDDPGGMICKCAEADALRSSFPTMLGGLYSREEGLPAAGGMDIPALPPQTAPTEADLKLVEGDNVPDEHPTQHNPTPAPSPKTGEPTPQDQLAEAITKAGFSFDDYMLAVRSLKLMPPTLVESSSFDELPTDLAKRHLRVVGTTIIPTLTERTQVEGRLL